MDYENGPRKTVCGDSYMFYQTPVKILFCFCSWVGISVGVNKIKIIKSNEK